MKFCPRCGTQLTSPSSTPADSAPNPSPANEAPDFPAGDSTSKLDWKRVSIFAVLFIALIGGGIWAAIFFSEQSKIAKAEEQELVASSCALKLQPVAPEISNAIDRPSNEVRIESARWHRVVGDTEYVVEYERESNAITTEIAEFPILIEEPPTASQQNDSSCEQAFREAASVPLSQDNNSEIRETTWACTSVDEWWSMLQRYPDVFGVTSYLESEKGLYVGSACLVGQGSPVCEDASRLGLTF